MSDDIKSAHSRQYQRINTKESFLSKIKNIPLEKNGCKIWTGTIRKDGYGQYWMNGKTFSVSRLLYSITKCVDLKGLVVRHKCDNPACCNINHLQHGTQKDNMMDASRRNRLRVGENNNKTTLNPEDVIKIRDRYPKAGISELAAEYKASLSCISCIISGKTWKHLPGSKKIITSNRAQGEKCGRAKLNKEKVLEIRKLYPKVTKAKLAKIFG